MAETANLKIRTISATQFRKSLPLVLAAVRAAGGEFVVTKCGAPVARIVPITAPKEGTAA